MKTSVSSQVSDGPTPRLDSDGLDGIFVPARPESAKVSAQTVPAPTLVQNKPRFGLLSGILIILLAVTVSWMLFGNPEPPGSPGKTEVELNGPSSATESESLAAPAEEFAIASPVGREDANSGRKSSEVSDEQNTAEAEKENPDERILAGDIASREESDEATEYDVKAQKDHENLAVAPVRESVETPEQFDLPRETSVALDNKTTVLPANANPIGETQIADKSPEDDVQPTAVREQVFPSRFAFGSSHLQKIPENDLVSVDTFLADCRGNLEIAGQTCDIGPQEINRRLGLARAQAVADFILARNRFEGTVALLSEGAENPVVPNSSVRNRALNRRVVLRCVSR